MKKALSLIFSVTILFTACKKDNSSTPEPNVTISQIYGKWNLISSAGGIAYIFRKPSVPTELLITQSNVLSHFVNYKQIDQASFAIDKITSANANQYLINFGDDQIANLNVIKAKRDTLVLSELMVEGFTYNYIREK